ncbi:uncharacterized protein ISCGN_011554 [Ixodes scapularis]
MAGLFQCELEGSENNVTILRANLTSDGDAYEWITSYGNATNTSWIFDWRIADPQRMVFHQKWRCQQSSVGKTAGRHATNCPAFVDIKIKKINKNTKKNDAFLKKAVPLAAVIKLREDHSHNPGCADELRLLKSTADTRALFHGYFKNGLTPAEAMCRHQEKLAATNASMEHLASGAQNPCARTVYHWYSSWRVEPYGEPVDPIKKLGEKAATHLQHGMSLATAS